MDVTLSMRTQKDPAKVYISGAMNFHTVAGLDEYLATVKTAREWLRKQPAKTSQEIK